MRWLLFYIGIKAVLFVLMQNLSQTRTDLFGEREDLMGRCKEWNGSKRAVPRSESESSRSDDEELKTIGRTSRVRSNNYFIKLKR